MILGVFIGINVVVFIRGRISTVVFLFYGVRDCFYGFESFFVFLVR